MQFYKVSECCLLSVYRCWHISKYFNVTLCALTSPALQNQKGLKNRYNLLVGELRSSEIPDYSATIMAFINTILVSTETRDERNTIRNQLSCECCRSRDSSCTVT